MGRGKLEHAVVLGLMLQGAKCRACGMYGGSGFKLCDVLVTQATRINNCMVLGKHCRVGLQGLRGLLESSGTPPCPSARTRESSGGGLSSGVYKLSCRAGCRSCVVTKSDCRHM